MVFLPAFSLVVLFWPSEWTSESNVAASSVEREVDYRNLDSIFSEIEQDLNDNKQVDKFGNKLTTLEVLAKRYEESATAGDRAAQFKLGAMNLEGVGVHTNYGDALRWFTKAGALDHPLAQLALGLFSLKCGEDDSRDDRFRESAIRALGKIGPAPRLPCRC